MIVIDRIVIALILEAEKFPEKQKKELKEILKEIDVTKFPTEEDVKFSFQNMNKATRMVYSTKKTLKKYEKQYLQFGGSQEHLNEIILKCK
jgi:hypothetical protein